MHSISFQLNQPCMINYVRYLSEFNHASSVLALYWHMLPQGCHREGEVVLQTVFILLAAYI